MSNIKWKPKEEPGLDQGMPVCGADDKKCEYAPNGCSGLYCTPQIIKMVQALKGLLACDSKKDTGNHWVDRLAKARQAVTP